MYGTQAFRFEFDAFVFVVMDVADPVTSSRLLPASDEALRRRTGVAAVSARPEYLRAACYLPNLLWSGSTSQVCALMYGYAIAGVKSCFMFLVTDC